MRSPESKTSLGARVEQETERNIDLLAEQLRSPLGVIPFVGAGFSTPFDFPQWGDLLRELGAALGRPDRERLGAAIDREDYLGAATILRQALDRYDLQAAIAEAFSDAALRRVDLANTDIAFVPLLSSGLVITTNFDGALEHVFAEAGHRLERVVGANPNEIVPAIQQNRLTLWKIHGDRKDARTRVLSTEEYDKHYRDLNDLLELAFANRPALFLGCDLTRDRTVTVLRKLQGRQPWLKHFAVLEYPAGERRFDARASALRKLGIRPIWYPKRAYTQIRPHLSKITQRASTSPLVAPDDAKGADDAATAAGKTEPRTATAARDILVRQLADLVLDPPDSVPNEPPEDTVPYPALLECMVRGELAFFLGAGAALGRLPMAHGFYTTLQRLVQGPSELSDERITQHYADRYGRGALDAKAQEMLAVPKPEPTVVHWFLATLTSRLREKGYRPRPPLILTTNFDDWMERALLHAGEPYHLFTFRLEGPYAGKFVYRSPSGDLLVVDRPTRFHRLAEDRAIVVRYHGGLHQDISLPVTYPLTYGDFMEVTRRLPEALPRAVMDRLAQSSLLFLGHGLADDSVEALARELHQRDGRPRSWAIQRWVRPGWPLYWSGLDVDILDIRLSRFFLEADQQLEALPTLAGR
jgi:hypothetical protein